MIRGEPSAPAESGLGAASPCEDLGEGPERPSTGSKAACGVTGIEAVRAVLTAVLRKLAIGFAAALFAVPAQADSAHELLDRGDAAWEHRADGVSENGRAAPGPINDAIQAYAAAVAAAADSLEARWKLVRALYFAGEFASPDESAARVQFERATTQAEAGLDLLGRRAGGRPEFDVLPPESVRVALPPGDVGDAAALEFWSAIAWGGWAQRRGLLAAVRQGVANRIYRSALVSVALDPELEEGGAHRLLARLHASLPRVPFFSGWVDRAQALPEMERALAIAPDHPGNRLLLALTILDVAPNRRAEALLLLETASTTEPRPAQRVEDLAIRKTARDRLAQERAATPRAHALSVRAYAEWGRLWASIAARSAA